MMSTYQVMCRNKLVNVPKTFRDRNELICSYKLKTEKGIIETLKVTVKLVC